MTKTTAPRVRHLNLYTVEQDGLPVAQAMAISQADAVRLYVESVQQPVLSARLSSPIEARTLAGLPLLQREPASTDTKTAGLFGDVPAADHVEAAAAPQVEPAEPVAPDASAPAETELKRQAEDAAERRAAGGKIVAKYRDPATGQTWSGRGMHPRWLVTAIEEGRTLDEFLIDAQGEQA